MNKKIRCAIYTRKSHEEGLEQAFNSLDAQRLAAESYIASQQHEGWVALSKSYDDGGYSGGTLNRPALQELFQDIENGLVDCVVVYKIDRLSRSLIDFSKIVELFDKHQVTFVAVTQSFNTSSSMGRLMLNVLLSFAQYERELTGERIRDKFAASKKKGMWMGGNPPLGYDICDRKLVINQEEAKLIWHIFSRFLVLRSTTNLARELNQQGHRTKRIISKTGKEYGAQLFTKANLRRTLVNPVYKGFVSHKDAVYEGEHEGILEPEFFDEVQRVFAKCPHVRGRESATKDQALLKNLIRCQVCDVAMTPTYTKKKDKRYRYYACSNHLRGKSCTSHHKTIASNEVERFVVQQVRELLKCPEITAKTLKSLEGQISTNEAFAMLQQIDVIWDSLFPIEQYRIICLLIKAVLVREDGIDVRIHTDGLQSLLLHAGMEACL